MNVEEYLLGSATPAFEQWFNAHPNSSIEEQETIASFVLSDIFKNWQKTHPNGTVDQYRMEVQQKNMQYFNSGQYKIDQLEEEIEQLKSDNEHLRSEIYYFEESANDLNESCNLFKTTTISFALLAGILGILLWRKWH